jgi:hypothetical protein
MSEIINLRRARKDKARAEADAKAAANRATHGRTKIDKSISKARAEKAEKLLDGHKREGDSNSND